MRRPLLGPLYPQLAPGDFVRKWTELQPTSTLVDIEEYSALPLRVP